MPIIWHSGFRETFYQFCSTRYGEKFFMWTLAQKIVGSKLDEVSIMSFISDFTLNTNYTVV